MNIIHTKKFVCLALIFPFTFLLVPTVMLPTQVMASPVILASQSVPIFYGTETVQPKNQSIVSTDDETKLVALNRHDRHRCERVRERCYNQCRHHHQNRHRCIQRCLRDHNCG